MISSDSSARAAFFLAQQAEHEVLGANVVVREHPCLFLSQDDHLAGALGKSLKQTRKDPPPLDY